MTDRGRTRSPKPLSPTARRSRSPSRDISMSISRSPSPNRSPLKTNGSAPPNGGFKVIVIGGITKNVSRGHLEEIFGEYGRVTGCDLPVFKVCKPKSLERQVWVGE